MVRRSVDPLHMTAPERDRWAVYCPEHGHVALDGEEYDRQMWAVDSLWKCPVCKRDSTWDGADEYE